MLNPLPTPSADVASGVQPFGAADSATIDACAQLIVRASRKQQHRWTRQTATRHIAELLSVTGAQAYVCRNGRGAPLCFVIGHAVERTFRVCELCADESLRHERLSLSLLEHVREAVRAEAVVFDAAQGRRTWRRLVRAL